MDQMVSRVCRVYREGKETEVNLVSLRAESQVSFLKGPSQFSSFTFAFCLLLTKTKHTEAAFG